MRRVLPWILAVGLAAHGCARAGLPAKKTLLQSMPISSGTGEKPQSKVWSHGGRWWCVLPNRSGMWLWRLDGDTWTSVLKLSARKRGRADCKPNGDVTHILLYRGVSSQVVSVEYVRGTPPTYRAWSARAQPADVTLGAGGETATIDIDSAGRMWLASDAASSIEVRYSDPPYAAWSAPVTLATGVSADDICVVTALPNATVGVLWSNQKTKRFGFRVHADGADPAAWLADEVPASASALPVGDGMADDHLNLAVAADGTLYAAVKTSYDTAGYPKIALLVRRPSGKWDPLYTVDTSGTRPIVVLNEKGGYVAVVYTASEGYRGIVYKASKLSKISLKGPSRVLMEGKLNNVSGTKQRFDKELVLIASSRTVAAGVHLATE